jgi:hypothetical protein
MKRFTLIVAGLVLGAFMISQDLYSRSFNAPDIEIPEVEEGENKVQVYPNPSDGNFQLTIDHQGEERILAKVFDITGKLVKDLSDELVHEDISVTAQVNLDSPKSGIYFLRIEIGNKVFTKKFIVR